MQGEPAQALHIDATSLAVTPASELTARQQTMPIESQPSLVNQQSSVSSFVEATPMAAEDRTL